MKYSGTEYIDRVSKGRYTYSDIMSEYFFDHDAVNKEKYQVRLQDHIYMAPYGSHQFRRCVPNAHDIGMTCKIG